MPRKAKKAVTQRIAGPVDIGSSRFPLSQGVALERVQAVHRLVFGGDTFFVVLYGALNAGGLIGTEYNGVAVLWENEGKVVLRDHFAVPSSMGAAPDRQRAEYDRICALDVDEFRTFVNGHPSARCSILVARPKPILNPKLDFKRADFKGVDFSTADDKVAFLTALIKFLCRHCQRDRFTRRIYDGLHLHLGHIAHYNMDGFYDEWFADLPARIRFLEHHAEAAIYGPWHDVARALKAWIAGPEGQKVLALYRTFLAARTEAADRVQLAVLKAKYETPDGKEA